MLTENKKQVRNLNRQKLNIYNLPRLQQNINPIYTNQGILKIFFNLNKFKNSAITGELTNYNISPQRDTHKKEVTIRFYSPILPARFRQFRQTNRVIFVWLFL